MLQKEMTDFFLELTINLKIYKSKEQEWHQQTHFDILKAIQMA